MSEDPADYWQFFSEDARRTGSEFYSRLAAAIGGDEDLRGLAALAKPGQPHANMILGAAHYLLLRGAEHSLRRFYPDLDGDARIEDEDPFPVFKDFVGRHRAEFETLISTRVTNTNEVGRSAILHAGFRAAAAEVGQPLHLVEIGTSAGLNMIWDRYGVRYRRDGANVAVIAPDAPLVIDSEVRGEKVPPTSATPMVASRVGLELNPVDLSREEDRDWLLALMWPDQIARMQRLRRAIELFRQERPPIRVGDALALLPETLRAIPEDGAVCVYHTIVVYQFSDEMRATLEEIFAVEGARRPVWRLSFEGALTGRYSLSLIRYRDGQRTKRNLALCHPHGTWIEWLV